MFSFQGPLPIAMAFGLMTLDTFNGKDFKHSTTCFKSYYLDHFDLQVDSRSLPGYPIERQGDLVCAFYYKYLNECNFYQNPYSSGPMTYAEFHRSNFFIIENLKRKNVFRGQLTLNLKFKTLLAQKLYLVMMPIYQKQMHFDEHLNVSISDMDAVEAEKADNAD